MGDDPGWPHRERIKVRYQEVDLQNVVFNAHYLGYCDIASAAWMHEAIGWTGTNDAVDWMLVKAVVEWQGSATFGDTLDLDCGVARWGTTSYDVAFRGTVDGRPTFTATITYVTIEPGTKRPTPVPAAMRDALGAAPG
ncbi:acyl-CoA thioesterase [Aquihabitans sp. G128]|uniref:acyl-CoA thioesterase n=1 Tax=Aquihabitans sp. G128 TaxID=2849779 RepID=UPI001C247153|nr:thioesterase family protein [Aquihabitans sp. G128]QXC61927.1 acyl-CoA thioesterase [Aquihabitans sp. G128]